MFREAICIVIPRFIRLFYLIAHFVANVQIIRFNDKYVIEFFVFICEFCFQMSKQMGKQRKDDILLSKIAARIKQLREEKDISQELFYIDTDIHIGRIESGKSNVTASTLSAICRYLNISLSDFFKNI